MFSKRAFNQRRKKAKEAAKPKVARVRLAAGEGEEDVAQGAVRAGDEEAVVEAVVVQEERAAVDDVDDEDGAALEGRGHAPAPAQLVAPQRERVDVEVTLQRREHGPERVELQAADDERAPRRRAHRARAGLHSGCTRSNMLPCFPCD